MCRLCAYVWRDDFSSSTIVQRCPLYFHTSLDRAACLTQALSKKKLLSSVEGVVYSRTNLMFFAPLLRTVRSNNNRLLVAKSDDDVYRYVLLLYMVDISYFAEILMYTVIYSLIEKGKVLINNHC